MKSWKYKDPPQPKWREFTDWFVPLLLWFPTCIGGWLVGFGLMDIVTMGTISVIISASGASYLTFGNAKEIIDNESKGRT